MASFGQSTKSKGTGNWVARHPGRSLPPITFLHMRPDPTLNVVSIDNQAGASMAVSHLLEQGCHTVGIITGPCGLVGIAGAPAVGGIPWNRPAWRPTRHWWWKATGWANSGQTGLEKLLDSTGRISMQVLCFVTIAWPWA